MPDSTPQYCVSCRFWLFNKTGQMLCRRRAPTRDLMCHPCWPSTNTLDWCGEFEVEQRPEIDRRKSLLRPPKDIKSIDGIDIE